MNTLEVGNEGENNVPLALQVIPPAPRSGEPAHEGIHVERAMQSLVLSEQHPIALELVGTAEYRSFIVRATTPAALQHVRAQLHALYPQLELRPLARHEDPFHLEEGEEIQAMELKAGGASYLPLRGETGDSDPILGIMAALSDLPQGTRVVTQLALVPAAPDWSKKHMRKAVEPALKRKKHQIRAEMSVDRTGDIYRSNILIGVIAGILLLAIIIQSILPASVINSLLKPDATPELIALATGSIVVLALLVFLISRILQAFFGTPIYDKDLVRQKTLSMAYHVRLRLYAIGSLPIEPRRRSKPSFWQQRQKNNARRRQLREHLLRLVAAYRQYHQAGGAYFKPQRLSSGLARHLVNPAGRGYGYGWQRGVKHSSHLLSVDALAALWHLPTGARLADIPLVPQRQARSLPIPPDLAHLFAKYPPIGYSDHGGYHAPFALIPQFFKVHTLLGGKSGEGKSTCIEHIARNAMERDGLVLIDPHDDLCDHLLRQVPLHRMEDVVVIDLSEEDAVIGLNPLDVTLGRERDRVVSDLIKTFAHIWPETWGPRMENAFEMALRTLFEANRTLVERHPYDGPAMQYTLLDMLPILTNEEFNTAILQKITDDYLPRWWKEYFDPLSPGQQREIIAPALSKITKFESVLARRIIGQSLSTLDLRDIIEERKILLVKLARGVVGDDIAALVGATLLNLIQAALEEQGYKAKEQRVRVPIILDEFQNLPAVTYAALGELRQHGATLILSTQSLQYLKKLDPVLLPTVLANVKQFFIFHMSADDADMLAPELGVAPEDILSLDPHMCYIKMPSEDHRYPLFSARIEPPPPGDPLLAESVRARSRVRYARRAEDVDEALHAAMLHKKRFTTVSVTQILKAVPGKSKTQDLQASLDETRNRKKTQELANKVDENDAEQIQPASPPANTQVDTNTPTNASPPSTVIEAEAIEQQPTADAANATASPQSKVADPSRKQPRGGSRSSGKTRKKSPAKEGAKLSKTESNAPQTIVLKGEQ